MLLSTQKFVRLYTYNMYKHNSNMTKCQYEDLIKYLKDKDLQGVVNLYEKNTFIRIRSMEYTLKSGFIPFVDYLLYKGHKWNIMDSLYAVENGTVPILEHIINKGCRVNDDILIICAQKGYIDCLKYLLKLDINHRNLERCYIEASKYGQFQILVQLFMYDKGKNITDECGIAASGYRSPQSKNEPTESLQCLNFLVSAGCRMTYKTMSHACVVGNLQCVKYLYAQYCPIDNKSIDHASYSGHIECLKFLLKNKCPFTEDALFLAKCKNNIECIKVLKEHMDPHDIATSYRKNDEYFEKE